ncbi:glycosyltransferase [Acetobacteraceae bacterium H6797]|nr:glycosyltransferase [Acetobacteraceae bacterium H6797]
MTDLATEGTTPAGAGEGAVSAAELLRVADSWRDMHEWREAARAYEGFLRLEPEAWGIMVQLGHCRKEAGEVDAALAAYRDAERLAPNDADLKLQIGHALKLSGELEAAAEAYRAALELDPGFVVASVELARLTEALEVQAMAELAPETAGKVGLETVFDVTDIVDYFQHKRTPTGIQRVQIGIVSRIAAAMGLGLRQVVLACFNPDDCQWRPLPADCFETLTRLSASGSSTEDPAWIAALAVVKAALAEAQPHVFQRGACLVNLGNSFGFSEYFRGIRQIQRLYGVKFIPFVHDCVPLIVPEHCQEQMVLDYARWFGGVAAHAHAILCNSESTRRDMLGQLNRLLPGRELPSAVVRLDADFRAGVEGLGISEAAALAEVAALRPGESFALFVSTIESRKNHQLVFSAWLQLLRRHGRYGVPRLVCVGKPGWHAEGAMNLLSQSPDLRRHVVLLSDISDQALAALYGAAAFTVYNSHYEGWGLPVTESLSYGKVPVIPDHSALPEAGGEGAVYFTSQNEPDLVEKLEKVIFDTGYRAAQEAKIAQTAGLRSWEQLKDQVMAEVAALAAEPGLPMSERLVAELGRYYPMSNRQFPKPSRRQTVGEMAREGASWYPMESWGVWMRGGYGRLRLPLQGADGAPLRLYLNLTPPPEARTLQVGIATAEEVPVTHLVTPLKPGPAFTAVIDLPALPPTEALHVDLDLGMGAELDKTRRVVGVGVGGFMLCRRDDLGARLDFIESLRFQPNDTVD